VRRERRGGSKVFGRRTIRPDYIACAAKLNETTNDENKVRMDVKEELGKISPWEAMKRDSSNLQEESQFRGI
jgi:hypothetical protein